MDDHFQIFVLFLRSPFKFLYFLPSIQLRGESHFTSFAHANAVAKAYPKPNLPLLLLSHLNFKLAPKSSFSVLKTLMIFRMMKMMIIMTKIRTTFSGYGLTEMIYNSNRRSITAVKALSHSDGKKQKDS